MSNFQITSASSTRLPNNRRTSNPLNTTRLTSSPLKTLQRTASSPSPLKRKASAISRSDSLDDAPEDDDTDLFTTRLEDQGLITALATDLNLRDIPQLVRYARDSMFDDIPPGGGFSSTRIAEMLNFRRNLPPIVTLAHIQALSQRPTMAQREIAELVGKGVVRKIRIPARGLGRNAVGECLVLVERWVEFVQGLPTVEEEAKRKYIEALRERRGRTGVPANVFTQAEASRLISAGLLTAASASSSLSSFLSSTLGGAGTASSLSAAGSRAATGSLGAVGGANAFVDAGGGGGGGLASASRTEAEYGPELTFSLPSVGVYLRLLEVARRHLEALLSKSKYKEAPASLLKERWDGAVTKPEKRQKGLEGVVLPANTKRWRQLYGLRFQWVLEECLGTGLIEVFETGSVGQGVRLT